MEGYWMPHTSSVDFCEPDYLHFNLVAEPFNALSSLYLCFIGFVAIIHGNITSEWMFVWPYIILIVIGLGSAALHASLHWFYQSLDEVPMIWMNMSMLYILTVLQNPQQMSNRLRSLLFLIVSMVATGIYYANRSWYAVFLVTFNSSGAILLFWIAHLVFFKNKGDILMLRVFCSGLFTYLLGAVPWLVDMNLCDVLVPYYMALNPLQGLTLHVVWHIAAGYGGHILILVLMYERSKSMGKTIKLDWIYYLIPIFREDEPKK